MSLRCVVAPLLTSFITWKSAFSLSLPAEGPFKTLNYDDIVERLHHLATTYPQLVQVYTAQERYKLASPGKCSVDGTVDCEQWVVHVTDHETLADDPERPEVFLSGCLHGNERVGPTAVVETAILMVYGAVCHADPSAQECAYSPLSTSPESVPWMARLVRTRSTVIMPMTNAIGYFQNDRLENQLDPNRDFPYQQKPERCMTTITARAVNEVWREHVFQLALTFHGGMVAMAYEWGSPNHPRSKNDKGEWHDTSPDDKAQVDISLGLSRFAGGFKATEKTFEPYPTGRMNELVYPVAGGMEDWAYAGSWDEGVAQCEPKTYDGYPPEKTRYNSAMLRCFNILVEASDVKSPQQETLGSREGLLDALPSTIEGENGHVARNVRLSLMLIDLVQPYVHWAPSTPLKAATGGQDTRQFLEADVDLGGGLDLEWTVGGAFHVNSTQLVWGPWPEDAEVLTPQAWESLADAAPPERRSEILTGETRWTSLDGIATKFGGRAKLTNDGGDGDGDGDRDGDGNNGVRQDRLKKRQENAFVMAVARVDQEWAEQNKLPFPNVPPQSHVVAARTSESWREENAGHVVRGHALWLTGPVKVTLASKHGKEDFNPAEPKAPVLNIAGEADRNAGASFSRGNAMVSSALLLLVATAIFGMVVGFRRCRALGTLRRTLQRREGAVGPDEAVPETEKVAGLATAHGGTRRISVNNTTSTGVSTSTGTGTGGPTGSGRRRMEEGNTPTTTTTVEEGAAQDIVGDNDETQSLIRTEPHDLNRRGSL